MKHFSEETRAKLREAKKNFIPWNKGLTKDDPRVASYSFTGKKHTEEAKEKMRLAKQNYVPWNVGLTKKDDSRIVSNPLKGQTKETSEIIKERAKKQSETVKKAYVSGQRKSWNFGLTKEDYRVRDNIDKTTETRKELFASGDLQTWNKELTTKTDERVKSNVLKGETKETSDILRVAGEKRSETMKDMFVNGELKIWNKGKTSETDDRVKQAAETHRDTNLKLVAEGKWHIWNRGKKGLQEAWNKNMTKHDHPGLMVISEARRQYMANNPGNFISSHELKVKKYLTSQGLVENEDFISQFYVGDIQDAYLADFYIPAYDMILEIDGLYWHGMGSRPELDKKRTEQMKEKGYIVVRFSDKDIDNKYDEVIMKINELLSVEL
jgi:very-short-patch-repair endonuclease